MAKVWIHLQHRIRCYTKINNRKPVRPYKTRSHYIQQLELLLCRRNTKVTEEDIDIKMNAIKKKNIFRMHSRQSIENTLHLLKMKEYAAEIKYLYSIINNITHPEISQSQ